jgi:hypothetical protein
MADAGGLLAKLQGMEKKATGKVSELVADLSTPDNHLPEAPDLQLPLWPEPVRGVPNSILRSALFGAVKRGKRAYQDGVKKASVDGVIVIHTGPQLDQADLDVWEQCLHLARTQGVGNRIEFSARSFLISIGRSYGKAQHVWLKGALRRLMTSLVELQDGKKAYAGQLLHEWARDDDHHVIEISPSIALMYGGDGWTQVEWSQRLALKGHPLALWLHGFYLTHAKPFAYKVETLHELCGSEATVMNDFRKDVRKAFKRIHDVTGWVGSMDRGGLVSVERKPSKSQQKHLEKKAITTKPKSKPGLKRVGQQELL